MNIYWGGTGNCARLTRRWLALAAICLGLASSKAADFTVTTPGGVSAYTINGIGGNPPLTLVRGRTYTFAVSTAANHPFRINSAGATPSGGISSGTITYTVPTNAASYTYVCTIHSFMTATITTVPPSTPPTPRIVNFSVTNNLIFRASPATNTFLMTPEFTTNVASSNWFALTVQSNRFSGNTNEIFCGRPPGTNLFFRLKVTAP
jgi:plastocyanin